MNATTDLGQPQQPRRDRSLDNAVIPHMMAAKIKPISQAVCQQSKEKATYNASSARLATKEARRLVKLFNTMINIESYYAFTEFWSKDLSGDEEPDNRRFDIEYHKASIEI